MRFVSSLQQELEDACDFSWYKALVKDSSANKVSHTDKKCGPLHALKFSSETILNHVLLMAGLTSVSLS